MQPDDPSRSNRKPPPYQDPESSTREFLHMESEMRKTMMGVIERNEKISLAMRNFLGYCFQAELDLRPSDCVLVQHPGSTPGAMTYWFQKRSDVETAGRRIRALEAENRALKAEINMLSAENDHLKQKAGPSR